MTDSVLQFVACVVGRLGLAGHSVLDVGGRDVNGTCRRCFTGRYVGVDRVPGPGVDLVADAAAMPFADGEFDVVLCTEMLEHDPRPWLSVREMARVLRAGGWLVLTVRGIAFPLHLYPCDYWRATTAAVKVLMEDHGVTPEIVGSDYAEQPGIFAAGVKQGTKP